jgi:hypothetical protein
VQDHIDIEKSKAYENIARAVGTRPVEVIRSLKKIPLHKYGIFIDTFNTDMEKQEKKQQAWEAFEKGQITYATFMLIDNIDNQKRAGQILAHELYRAQKLKEKEVKQQQDNLLALEDKKHANKMEEINTTGEWDVKNRPKPTKDSLLPLLIITKRRKKSRVWAFSRKVQRPPFAQQKRSGSMRPSITSTAISHCRLTRYRIYFIFN